MASSDPFLPVQPGDQTPVDGSDPTEEELEADRGDSPDPESDGPTDEGLPPVSSTPFQRPDGDAVDPASL